LEVLQQSHLGFTLYPAFALVKRRTRRHAGDSVEGRRIVESRIRQTRHSVLLTEMLRLEAWLGRVWSFPFGIRCVVVGRKSFATGDMKRTPR
jgi:hypothetical protein